MGKLFKGLLTAAKNFSAVSIEAQFKYFVLFKNNNFPSFYEAFFPRILKVKLMEHRRFSIKSCASLRLRSQMHSLRQVTRQMFVYFITSSLDIVFIHNFCM